MARRAPRNRPPATRAWTPALNRNHWIDHESSDRNVKLVSRVGSTSCHLRSASPARAPRNAYVPEGGPSRLMPPALVTGREVRHWLMSPEHQRDPAVGNRSFQAAAPHLGAASVR